MGGAVRGPCNFREGFEEGQGKRSESFYSARSDVRSECTSNLARSGVVVVRRGQSGRSTQGCIGTGTRSSEAPSSRRASRFVFANHREGEEADNLSPGQTMTSQSDRMFQEEKLAEGLRNLEVVRAEASVLRSSLKLSSKNSPFTPVSRDGGGRPGRVDFSVEQPRPF